MKNSEPAAVFPGGGGPVQKIILGQAENGPGKQRTDKTGDGVTFRTSVFASEGVKKRFVVFGSINNRV